LVCAPWFIDDDEFVSVDDWLAETLESVVLLPLPMFRFADESVSDPPGATRS
jgi:hypothetical protein